ncbi:hypothetical protein N44_01126 [Microcystis aeruginosa NIES-44]|uniref:Uncharacterized protein n=1 Tax=Microcystis aeruginosa NIES-44 TaxID=449439 RepID=A0A0A1VSZ0_MICAE|nr:hypothetical protein N44_01126 [Microcystis aeruginosa NIES-44]
MILNLVVLVVNLQDGLLAIEMVIELTLQVAVGFSQVL